MFSLAVAAMNRSVVAVDAVPVNLAYIRESLSLGSNSQNVRTINNAVGWVDVEILYYIKVTIWENLHFPIQLYIIFIKYSSDNYTLLYPYTPDPGNPGMTFMKTSKQVKKENLIIAEVRNQVR